MQKIAKLLCLGVSISLVAGLLVWPKPVSAGVAYWSAETIPYRLDNSIGPAGIDVRDFAIANDALTTYAVTGDSITDVTITDNVVYKSTDAGLTWTALPISISADLVAVAPDDANFIAIANTNNATIYLSVNGGTTWYNLGTPQESGGGGAVAVYDIAISETRTGYHYIAAAGKEAGDTANLWYFKYGATAPTWQETNTLTGAGADSEVAAIAFSPSFTSDAALVAVTDNAGAGVKLQMLDLSAEIWNSSAGYAGFPCTVVSNTGLNRLNSASLALAPTYDANDDDTRKVFIGLAVDGNASANATSGIYRFDNTAKTSIRTNTYIHSIAYIGSRLVAGAYDSTTVYRCSNPLSYYPTVYSSTLTKKPGGENKVIVAWKGTSAAAGTSGNESSFSISTDYGATFNDISLIDTVIANATDVAVSKDGSKVYFVTDDGNDLSLWRRASAWQRVFSQQGATGFMVRIEPQSANVIYLIKKGATTIYYNSSGGATPWYTRTCNINIQDMAVESTAVAYALNATGFVSKTVNAGAAWANAIQTNLESGATLASVSSDTLIATSQHGFVDYSTDGGSSWTRIIPFIEAGAGKVQIVPDENFATNKFIYAASDANGQNIMRWKIGISTSWTDIFEGTLPAGIYGMAINNNTLYALEFNAASGQSTLWRHISPATAKTSSTDWIAMTTSNVTNPGDDFVHLNATPKALKASSGKLWAVKTNGTNKLYSLTDFIMDVAINLLQPESGFSSHVNLLGTAFDVPFIWERPSVSTEYELRISMDEEFDSLVASIIVPSDQSIVFVLVGPNQTGNNTANFMPGVTYYWKIRTTKPGFSLYSKSKYFTVEPTMASVPQVLGPPNGGINIRKKPAFSWQPLAGTTEYQFILSENSSMTSPIIDTYTDKAGFKLPRELEYGKTYFWQIRATKPAASDWSALASFTVASEEVEPGPPVIVKEIPPESIELPASPPENVITLTPPLIPPPPVTPNYLVGALVITGILLAIVLVLLVVGLPARLLPAWLKIPGPVLSTYGKIKAISKRPPKPREKPISRARAVKPPATPLDKAIRKTPADKTSEGETIAFAAKSFMWMATAGEGGEGSEPGLSLKERQALGKKLAARIQKLASKALIYKRYPGDAAMFLNLWANYGSRKETNNYLSKSFQSRPENAIALLKCYLPGSGVREFTLSQYTSLSEVVEPSSVYAALTKLFKFKADNIEEKVPVEPEDRVLAHQFMRIHLQEKGKK